MNSNTNKNNNPYGHLLDKYLEPSHLERKERQKQEEEAKMRYGNLLNRAKPDYSTFELMAKMEDERMEHCKRMEDEKKLESLRRQMRIEDAQRKEEEHNAEVRGYAESIMARKEACGVGYVFWYIYLGKDETIYLNIFLNSGMVYRIICKEKKFLKEVMQVIEYCINNHYSKIIQIDFESCNIVNSPIIPGDNNKVNICQ